MLADINGIRGKVAGDRFEFSKHAADQTILRGIRVREAREAINDGRVIEDYPDDKYGPSCLVLGFAQAGRSLHIQSSYPSRTLVEIITVYEPEPKLWSGDFTTRRSEDGE